MNSIKTKVIKEYKKILNNHGYDLEIRKGFFTAYRIIDQTSRKPKSVWFSYSEFCVFMQGLILGLYTKPVTIFPEK